MLYNNVFFITYNINVIEIFFDYPHGRLFKNVSKIKTKSPIDYSQHQNV